MVFRMAVAPGRIATVFGNFREAGKVENITAIITILSQWMVCHLFFLVKKIYWEIVTLTLNMVEPTDDDRRLNLKPSKI